MTYQQLQKELSNTKKGLEKAKELSSTRREELLETRKQMNGLILQYERVIKEYKKTLDLYKQHLTKIFFITWFFKIKKKLGGD